MENPIANWREKIVKVNICNQLRMNWWLHSKHKLHVHLAMHARQGCTWAINHGRTNLRCQPTNPTKYKTPLTAIGFPNRGRLSWTAVLLIEQILQLLGCILFKREMAQACTSHHCRVLSQFASFIQGTLLSGPSSMGYQFCWPHPFVSGSCPTVDELGFHHLGCYW